MEQRQLGKSGLRVSALSLGAMTFGDSPSPFTSGITSPDDEARRVFDAAIDAGVNLIDTANVYGEGRSEELIGAWARGKRDRLLIATKCRFPVGLGSKPFGPHDHGLSRKHVLAACDASLARLGTDHIDLYQVHMQDIDVSIDETLRALDDLVTAGKVRYAGCSNYTGYRLVESLWSADKNRTHRYEAMQLQWSLVNRGAEREMIPACRAFGLGVLVYSPLARGFLTGKYDKGVSPPAGSRLEIWKESYKATDNEQCWAILDVVREVATRLESTPAAVSLAWLLTRPEVSSIIMGARTAQQLAKNLDALALTLPPDEIRRLDEASRPAWGYPYAFIQSFPGSKQPW